MKRSPAYLLSLILFAADGCGGNSTVDNAYDVYKKGGDYTEAAAILSADTIDYGSLSMKDFAKLGVTLTYISAYTIDETDKINMDRFEEVSREYELAKRNLTPEQKKKLTEERAGLITR